MAYFNLVSTGTRTETELEKERRVSYVGVTRPKKSLIITTQKGEISPFIREFFLNPSYYGLQEDILQNQIITLDAEANILKVNLLQVDVHIQNLYIKYPEFKGEYIKITGLFKKIRQDLRAKTVHTAFQKL